jgi:hypothetical protein
MALVPQSRKVAGGVNTFELAGFSARLPLKKQNRFWSILLGRESFSYFPMAPGLEAKNILFSKGISRFL